MHADQFMHGLENAILRDDEYVWDDVAKHAGKAVAPECNGRREQLMNSAAIKYE